jgi:hypothetical protein
MFRKFARSMATSVRDVGSMSTKTAWCTPRREWRRHGLGEGLANRRGICCREGQKCRSTWALQGPFRLYCGTADGLLLSEIRKPAEGRVSEWPVRCFSALLQRKKEWMELLSPTTGFLLGGWIFAIGSTRVAYVVVLGLAEEGGGL